VLWPGSNPEVVRLLLWRHGQTTFNVERRFQGQTDVPLNAVGRQQAETVARYIAAFRPDAIYSSDLSRAVQTAEPLARLTGLTVQLDKDLRERNGGAWEGKTDVEIREQYADAYAAWQPPDGETAEAVAERGAAALERIADSMTGGSLAVVVGHGANLNFGLAKVLGIPVEARLLGPFGNCNWSVLGKRAGHWRLLQHNVGRLPEPVPGPDEADGED
jgi:glucosyl-3-phosphoglycerate phosphatase